MLNRAYSLLTVKSVDVEGRTISGVATTPSPDRVGDIVEPLGIKFANPLPLLLYHDSTRPVGSVKFDKPTKDGVTFTAKLVAPDDVTSAGVKERVAEAWDSLKSKLIRGVSIGFRAMPDGVELIRDKDGAYSGLRFLKTEVLELSLVTIPANAEATISSLKSLDAPHLAASGRRADVLLNIPGASGRSTSGTAMTNSERLTAKKTELKTKSLRMDELLKIETEDGLDLNDEQKSEYNRLMVDAKDLSAQIGRLAAAEEATFALAKGLNVGNSVEESSTARETTTPRVEVKDPTPPGMGFARYALCKAAAFIDHRNVLEIVKERYPNDRRLMNFAKASVPAGTTTEATWASPLVYADNLASEFIEYLRPLTIIGKLGTNGVPGFTRVPFNVRIMSETQPGNGYWVGEGAPKPLTSFGFSPVTLGYNKVAAISVITQELARFSSPSAEERVRNGLAKAIVARIDTDLVDPAHAATSASPASLTNGLTAKTSAGSSADNARTDMANLLSDFIEANVDPTSLVLIMPSTLALALSLMVNALGQKEFSDLTMRGGSILGIPVVTSQYAANQSGGGNLVIAVNASDVFLADDGGVTIDASSEASLQMLDNPTNNSATATATQMVSMFQTNSIALRAERFITWKKARTTAVVYMDDVNWGSIGSPA